MLTTNQKIIIIRGRYSSRAEAPSTRATSKIIQQKQNHSNDDDDNSDNLIRCYAQHWIHTSCLHFDENLNKHIFLKKSFCSKASKKKASNCVNDLQFVVTLKTKKQKNVNLLLNFSRNRILV